jgi:hypothetical protein
LLPLLEDLINVNFGDEFVDTLGRDLESTHEQADAFLVRWQEWFGRV